MPDLEALAKAQIPKVVLGKLVRVGQPDVALRKFKQPVSPKQPDVAVTTLSRSIEVKPA